MRTKRFFFAAFVAASASVFAALFLSGCNHSVASNVLYGRWVAGGPGGTSLEFSHGRFTRTLPGNLVETGTYSTDGRYVTFHMQGRGPETLWFRLEFPRLTMGAPGRQTGRTYFHDSPGEPPDLEGVWLGFRGEGTSWTAMPFMFRNAEPRRENRWVMEGEHELSVFRRGRYTVSARNIPNTGLLTMRTTYIHGGDLRSFILYRLHVRIMVLFDAERLRIPEYGDWWFTLDEAGRLFVDAAVAADGDLSLERLVMLAKDSFFAGAHVTSVFEFTLEEREPGSILDIAGNVMDGSVMLTLRGANGVILTFVKPAGSGGGSAPTDGDYVYVFGYGPRLRNFTGAWAPEGILSGSRSAVSEVRK